MLKYYYNEENKSLIS